MKFTKTTNIDASAEKVWEVFAHGFDDAYEWMASIPHSYGQDIGTRFEGARSAGRVCQLNADASGLKASEQFLAYDEEARRCTVRIDFVDTPRVFPVHYNELNFAVVDNAAGGSTVTWGFSSKIKTWGYVMWPVLRAGAPRFVGQIAEELAHYVETGTPHPRKVTAMEKASSRTRG